MMNFLGFLLFLLAAFLVGVLVGAAWTINVITHEPEQDK